MANILLLIGGHLWTSPRSQKEADALALAGHAVTIAGVWFDETGAQRDSDLSRSKPWRFHAILDLRRTTRYGRIRSLRVRLCTRFAREIYSRWRHCMPAVLGYGAADFLRFAKTAAADLTVVHSESGLWVGSELLKHNYKVGVDFEDWFSRDLPPEARASRPIAWLEQLERLLGKNCIYSVTTSRAMANAIASEYSIRAPKVVYNVFPKAGPLPRMSRGEDRRELEVPSIHWFSQTIGPGRGLEMLFVAAARIDLRFEIHLRGALRADSKRWLQNVLPSSLRERLFLHDTVPNDELPCRIAEHDIGLALETSSIRSKDLTISNKVFQYLQSGLAVIATDTAGQKEVFEQAPGIGVLVKHDDALSLEGALRELLTDRPRLERAKAAARAAAHDQFGWELQRQVVQSLAESALNGPR